MAKWRELSQKFWSQEQNFQVNSDQTFDPSPSACLRVRVVHTCPIKVLYAFRKLLGRKDLRILREILLAKCTSILSVA